MMENRFFQILCHCLVLFIALLPAQARAGGLIINEASNGPSGAKEFIELIVVGSQANPTDPVDLSDWIIDDNNGDWGGGGTGIGTSSGYWRISTATCNQFSAISPGSVIVFYNDADVNPALPPDDENDANGDDVYVVPSSSNCVSNCPGPPSSSNNGYSSCAVPLANTWRPLKLRNGGDVVQSRDASATLFHGFSYGSVGAPLPSGSFNVSTSSGKKATYIFSCGDWYIGGNFARQSYTTDSPGAANNADNVIFRQKITNGTFDYTAPNSAANCSNMPSLAITKSSEIVADGISVTNPMTIPGGEIVYTVNVENGGFGAPDNDSILIIDSLPTELRLFVGDYFAGAPVRFIDGPVSSGLTFTFTSLASTSDDVDFSNDNGVSFTYVPTPDGAGYDSQVTHLRLTPKGVLAAASSGSTPSFSFELKSLIE